MKTSIIVCTYNPNINSFTLLLRRLTKLYQANYEIIIVDNNSSIELIDIIKAATDNFFQHIKYFIEEKQGLSYARKKGIENATGDIIVFFDDDNLPDINYLQNVENILNDNKFIGIIGPGKVNVEFFKKNSSTQLIDESQLLHLFQQKNIKTLEYANSIKCMEVFPEGTGMAMRKEIADEYASNVDNFKTTGRKGKSLASGEDFQIIYQCINKGYAAGRSPLLTVQHLIPIEKTEIKYIRRLKFGQTYSVPLAMQECFPETTSKNIAIASQLTNFNFMLGILSLLVKPSFYKNSHWRNLEIARKCGWYYGYHLAANTPTPIIVKFFIKLFKLK